MTDHRLDRRDLLKTTGAAAIGVGVGTQTAMAQTAEGPTVYVLSEGFEDGDGTLYAVNAATGTQEWAFTDIGGSASPTVVNGTVYAPAGWLHAVDAATGEQEWVSTHLSAGGVNYSSPTAVNGNVYVGSWDNALYAVDAATGQEEWEFHNPPWFSVRSSPTMVDGTVYVGSEGGILYAVDAATGQEEWTFPPGVPTYRSARVSRTSSPTVVEGTVYVGGSTDIDTDDPDDALLAVDAATGSQEWAFTQPSDWVGSSPTVVDGTVYVGSEDDTLYAVDAATGQKEWAFTQPSGSVQSSPTVVDGTVYVGGDSTLYAVDAATGQEEWAFTEPSHFVSSSPTVVDGTVYVASPGRHSPLDGDHDPGALYAVDAATGNQEWTFTEPSFSTDSSPTVVADPESGDSVGSRVLLGTLGHHDDWAHAGQSIGTDPDDRDGEDADGGGDDDTDDPDDGDTDDTDDPDDGDTDDDDGFGPGFGVGGALAGLGGAGYLLKRRLDDEDSEE